VKPLSIVPVTIIFPDATFTLYSTVARREVFISVSAFKPKVKNIAPGVDRAHCRIIIIIIIIIVVIIIFAFHGDE
jgi:hypothetical protein